MTTLTPAPTPLLRPHPNARDAQQVEVLAGMGASIEFIAHQLKLTPADISLHYATQLAHGEEEANLRVAKTFHELATSGENPQLTVAWLKMRGGSQWQEPNRNATPTPEEDVRDVAQEKLLTLLNRGK